MSQEMGPTHRPSEMAVDSRALDSRPQEGLPLMLCQRGGQGSQSTWALVGQQEWSRDPLSHAGVPRGKLDWTLFSGAVRLVQPSMLGCSIESSQSMGEHRGRPEPAGTVWWQERRPPTLKLPSPC